MRFYFVAFALIASAAAQGVRPKDVREVGKAGSSAIPHLTEFLKDPSTDVRVEAVKQLTSARALDALILATMPKSKSKPPMDWSTSIFPDTCNPASAPQSSGWAAASRANSPIRTTRSWTSMSRRAPT
jgi:hypothetical protein